MGSIGQPSAGHCKDRCAGQHDNHAVSDSTVAARFEQMLAAPDKKAAAIKLGWVDERGSYQDLRDAVGPGNLEAHHGPQSQNALERREVVNMIMELMVLCTMPLAVKKVPRYEAGGSRTRVLSAADDVGHRFQHALDCLLNEAEDHDDDDKNNDDDYCDDDDHQEEKRGIFQHPLGTQACHALCEFQVLLPTLRNRRRLN
ncbi:hypothetical protein AK812_SmicGene33054 [Symbiodinium microadriaticum]|uniref:Uncharacterized protein n=1 Tax=Symbiodinium microadriaticum TaxID=2951 RepID=A0A1Q9CSK8_SYMMI|nr:hypothetical protein AK812_SmicGene33054 [Symbiodinium microadriaticum]